MNADTPLPDEPGHPESGLRQPPTRVHLDMAYLLVLGTAIILDDQLVDQMAMDLPIDVKDPVLDAP
ncbi:hypothetical protein ACFL2T_03920 [Elusimicrobiota bacterium]